jgi:hypothetical protein
MKLSSLFPKPVRRELDAIASELRADHPEFDPETQPFHLTAVVLVWCVAEIVKLRETRS